MGSGLGCQWTLSHDRPRLCQAARCPGRGLGRSRTRVSLAPNDKKAFRQELARFCLVAEKYRGRWSYTEQRPYTGLGEAPSGWHYDDCSAYVALAYYWAGRMAGHGVADPLGEHFTGWGNTETAHAF